MVEKEKMSDNDLDKLILEEGVLTFQYYMNPTEELRNRLLEIANRIDSIIILIGY